MEAPAVGDGPSRCAVHPGRGAVERCASCGRGTCLSCAIPFRGRVLCMRCAARELGEPSPAEAAPAPPRRPHTVATLLFTAALIASVWPWDRFGVLTGFFSAWTPRPGVWPFSASVLLLLATVGAALGGRLPGRLAAGGSAAAGTLAVLAVARVLVGSPDFVRHTATPYVVLMAAAAGVIVSLVRLRRERTT